MSGRVIHLSDETHAQLSRYCRANALVLRPWAESVLIEAAAAGRVPEPVPVPKKRLPAPVTGGKDAPGPKPYELPPFWRRGEASKEEKREDGGTRSGVGPKRG